MQRQALCFALGLPLPLGGPLVSALILVRVLSSLKTPGDLCLTFSYCLLSSSQAKLWKGRAVHTCQNSLTFPFLPWPHCSLAFASTEPSPQGYQRATEVKGALLPWVSAALPPLILHSFRNISPLDFSHGFLPNASIILSLHGRLPFDSHFRCRCASEFCPRILAFLFHALIPMEKTSLLSS